MATGVSRSRRRRWVLIGGGTVAVMASASVWWLIITELATGYTILTCTHGDMALEQAMQQPTPLLITDYNLPGMNGLQLTAALKARAAPLGDCGAAGA